MAAMVMLAVLLAIVVVGLIILWLAVRKRKSSPRVLPMRKPTPSEHGATHHAIWLPVAQELGLDLHPPEQCDAASPESTPSTLLRLTGKRRGASLTVEVQIPTLLPAGVWQRMRTGKGMDRTNRHTAQALRDFQVRVDAPLAAPTPDGLRVVPRSAKGQVRTSGSAQEVSSGNRALDELVQVHGTDRDRTRAIVSDARVQTALTRLARLGVPFDWSKKAVTITAHPADIDRFRPGLAQAYADAAAGLVAAAEARHAAPWQKLGKATGLQWSGRSLKGRISGVPVEVDAGFDTGVATVQVSAAFRALRLAIHDPGGPGDPVKFPAPELARSLSGRTTDKFLARRVLSDETTITALLALLHRSDGAALVDGTIRLPVLPDDRTPAMLQAAADVSRRLSRLAR